MQHCRADRAVAASAGLPTLSDKRVIKFTVCIWSMHGDTHTTSACFLDDCAASCDMLRDPPRSGGIICSSARAAAQTWRTPSLGLWRAAPIRSWRLWRCRCYGGGASFHPCSGGYGLGRLLLLLRLGGLAIALRLAASC